MGAKDIDFVQVIHIYTADGGSSRFLKTGYGKFLQKHRSLIAESSPLINNYSILYRGIMILHSLQRNNDTTCTLMLQKSVFFCGYFFLKAI